MSSSLKMTQHHKEHPLTHDMFVHVERNVIYICLEGTIELFVNFEETFYKQAAESPYSCI